MKHDRPQPPPRPERPPEDLEAIKTFAKLVDSKRAGNSAEAAQARRRLVKLGWPISVQAGPGWRVTS